MATAAPLMSFAGFVGGSSSRQAARHDDEEPNEKQGGVEDARQVLDPSRGLLATTLL